MRALLALALLLPACGGFEFPMEGPPVLTCQIPGYYRCWQAEIYTCTCQGALCGWRAGAPPDCICDRNGLPLCGQPVDGGTR